MPTLQCRHGYVKHWPRRRIREVEGANGATPSVHVDFWFMRDDEVDEIVTVINYTEKHTKAFGADVAEKKGLEDEVAERITKHCPEPGLQRENHHYN